MKINYLLLVSSFILLSACAEQQKKSSVLVPVEERNAPVVQKNSEESTIDNAPEIQSEVKAKKTRPVIIALMDEADNYVKDGHSNKAAASIERALRIEPKNALLWQRLAKIRLQQQQWQQAIALARKSNTLAGDNRNLKSENWGVIAIAYEKMGNKQKAEEARKKQTGQV
ncbi:MAG: tetratricopeptide repeat protein [Proteobacteria bacterium]|nr:tetratricopeptide repeat protein [Pseudomonadota bacterium]